MVSPLAKTRREKLAILRDINAKTFLLVTFPKYSLDRMDHRSLKKIQRKLNELFDRAKPLI